MTEAQCNTEVQRMLALAQEYMAQRDTAMNERDAARKTARALRIECREHRFQGNPYGTFSDALRNLATEISQGINDNEDRRVDWCVWLRMKAADIEKAVALASIGTGW